MILVTGAAGKTGRAVIQALKDKGRYIKALVYHHDQELIMRKLGVQDIVVGDMRSQLTLDEALRGVRAIYHICPNMHPDEVQIGGTVIEAASSAGIERFIYHSVLHPQIESMPHHWHKLRVEELLFESGLSWTILQPAAYMQNILTQWDQIVEHGIYAVPYALDKRLSIVDLMDVAAVAAIVTSERGHEYGIYELCGPELLSPNEIAAKLGQKLELEIKGIALSIDLWVQKARNAGLSTYAIGTLVKMFRYYELHEFRGNSQVLGWLLGRSAVTFDGFLDRVFSEYGSNSQCAL